MQPLCIVVTLLSSHESFGKKNVMLHQVPELSRSRSSVCHCLWLLCKVTDWPPPPLMSHLKLWEGLAWYFHNAYAFKDAWKQNESVFLCMLQNLWQDGSSFLMGTYRLAILRKRFIVIINYLGSSVFTHQHSSDTLWSHDCGVLISLSFRLS